MKNKLAPRDTSQDDPTLMAQIHYLPDAEKVHTEPGETILHAALRAGIPHAQACGGNARCSTCRVAIVDGQGQCVERNAQEEQMARRLRFGPEIRLACQTSITGDVTVRRLVLDAEDVEITRRLTSASFPVSVGEEKKLAILFADIRGFTRFAECLPPYDVIYVLNRYFYDMSQAVSRHGGYIDICIGDGLMALFGVTDARGPALRAVRAGLDMLEAVEKLKPFLQNVYRMRLEIGVGVHFGEVVVGSVGGGETIRMTAIGDAVNLASRIEAANKECDTRLLVSESTFLEVQPSVLVGQQFQRSLKGKRGKYRLYEIIGLQLAGSMTVRLEHANLLVRDIDATIHFLQTAFPEFRIRFDGLNRRGVRWVHIGIDETYIALTQSTVEPEQRWTPYAGRPGVNHLAYEVDDVDALHERLKSAGYQESTPVNNHPYRKRIYFFDRDGNDWEFVQYLTNDPAKRHDYAIPDQ